MKPRTRARTPSSIASNQSSKRKESAATAASFMVSLVMAWSPSGASTPESVGLEQPGDYANLIPTTSATEPCDVFSSARDKARCACALEQGGWVTEVQGRWDLSSAPPGTSLSRSDRVTRSQLRVE